MGFFSAGKRGRRRLMGVAALAILGLAAFFVYQRVFAASGATPVRYVTAQAEKGTITQSVSGTGNLAQGTTASVDPGISGQVTDLQVKVGDKVTKDQLLFKVANDQLDLDVAKAQSDYDQAKQNVVTAKLKVLQAEQTVDDLKQQQIDQSTSTTAPPTTAPHVTPTTNPQNNDPHPTTTAPYPTTTTQPVPTTTPPTTLPPTTTTQPGNGGSTTTATTAPASAALRVSLVALTVAQAQSNSSASAQSGGKVTDLDIEVAEQDIVNAQLGVTAAENAVQAAALSLQDAKDTAAKRDVKATIDGVVTAVNVSEGDTLGSSSNANQAAAQAQGSNASSTPPILISDAATVKASVSLTETDIASVKEGQKATLTFDALPDLTLTGKVDSVDAQGTVSQGVVSFNVDIVPEVSNEQLKAGMTVTADIITNVKTDVLTVPSSAVKTQGGATYVELLQNGQPVNQTVEAGISNDTSTEIVSGLNAGQQVVTQTINASRGNTTTTNRGGNFGVPGLGGGGAFPGAGGGGAVPGGGQVFRGPGG